MNEIKLLTNQQLHKTMIRTSEKERQLTLQMISYIEEVDRRKSFLELGYGSLYDYLTLGLKYSSGSAMRRINSARLIRELPDVKPKVENGDLSLSNLAQAYRFFKDEEKNENPLDLEQKQQIVEQLEGQSTRQAEQTLIAMSSQPLKAKAAEKVKVVSPDLTQIQFLADSEYMEQLEEVKGLLVSQMPDARLSEIMAEVMKLSLEVLRKKRFKLKSAPVEETETESDSSVGGGGEGEPQKLSRPVPAKTSRKVWDRDEGKCSVIHPHTGKPCDSTFDLQIDHRIPWALGGNHDLENLRLACRQCNRREAVRWFGLQKVALFTESSPAPASNPQDTFPPSATPSKIEEPHPLTDPLQVHSRSSTARLPSD